MWRLPIRWTQRGEIAKRRFGVETLETRNMDGLDFHARLIGGTHARKGSGFLKGNPMSTISEFFRRHHAVPANDRGPIYDLGSDEAIHGNAAAACKAWDENPEARGVMLPDMKDLRAETAKRGMNGMWSAICDRIGYSVRPR